MNKPVVEIFRLREKLPTDHYAEIGRIITRFAQIEMQLRNITYLVLGVGRKQGRLAVNQFRAGDQVFLIKDLAQLNGFKLNVNWSLLKKQAKEIESYRDRLSHCIWIKRPDTKVPVLQDFSTAYIPSLPQGTRPKLTPLAVIVPRKILRQIRINGDRLSKEIFKIERDVLRQTGSWRRKPHAPRSPTRGKAHPHRNHQ